MSFRFALLLTTTLLALASSANAEKPFHGGTIKSKADALYRSGLRAYDAQDYARATRDFEAALKIDSHRNILFALAQTLRMSGDCEGANGLYHRFVASSPSDKQVEATKVLIDECREVLRRERLRTEEAASNERAEQLETEGQAAAHHRRDREDGEPEQESASAGDLMIRATPQTPRWYQDTLGLSLASAGVLSLAAGTGFALSSQSAADRAGQARNYLDFDELADKSERHRIIAIATTIAGGSLLVGGIVRLLLVPDASTDESEGRLSLQISEQQHTIGIQGRF